MRGSNKMNRKIAVVGLGYVGLPVAVAFGNKNNVIGFDTNRNRIETLKKNIDYTNEITESELKSTNITFSYDENILKEANFIIVAVPTPINKHKQPNLTPLIKASETVGKNLKEGAIVVFESTVYPGTTEEKCVPVLEKFSGLKCGVDFHIGYSPERINPGDKKHSFTNIIKVVSGQTPEILEIVANTYRSVVNAGIHKASSIKVAEAAKVIENTQRDVNIALMNELAMIFNLLEIDTEEVLAAARTKWNFLNFTPGLVGGHCIGVDPYYLTHKAQEVGYHPEVILAGRRINDDLGKYIASTLVKYLIKQDTPIKGSIVTILGLTFKENVPDLRNSKVIDIINELKEYGVLIQVADYEADSKDAMKEYGIKLKELNDLKPADAVILAVPHKDYVGNGWNMVDSLLKKNCNVVFDIKSVLPKSEISENYNLWRL